MDNAGRCCDQKRCADAVFGARRPLAVRPCPRRRHGGNPPADAKFITNQARAQHELGGKHAGKSIEQVYREDPGHLHAQAYNGTIYGTHVGNYLRLKDDSLFDPAAQLNQHIRTKAGR